MAAPQEEIREAKELLRPRHLEQGGDKVVVYDPQGGTRYAAQSYDPYTGTYKARSGGSTPYGSWERGVAVQGDDWAKGGYYGNSRGTLAGGSTSEGGKVIGAGNGEGDRGFVGRDRNGDLYEGSRRQRVQEDR